MGHEPKNEEQPTAPSRFYKGPADHRGEPEARVWQGDEFPHRKSIAEIDRRNVLKLMGGAMAMAGIAGSGCRSLIMPQEKIIGYVQAPENRVSGISKHFATTACIAGEVVGMLVRSHEGRPVKLEGNPKHPASLGGLDAKQLASIHGLYDPDRLDGVKYKGDMDNWPNFLKNVRASLKNGGVAIVTPNVTSPALAKSIEDFLGKHPNATWYQWEACHRDLMHEAGMLATGQAVRPVYDFSRADVVVSIDCDVFNELPGATAHARNIAAKRNPDGEMSRLYAFESAPTTFGALADHRSPVRASQMGALVRALGAKLGMPGVTAPGATGADAQLVDAMVRDLQAHRGRCVVVAGGHLPPAVQAAVYALNEALGNLGATVTLRPSATWATHNGESIRSLAEAIKGNKVHTLLLLGVNPVYDAPADLDFGTLVGTVPFTAQLSLYDDETGEKCQFQLPESHYLEAWGDHLAFDGTVSIQQPLIKPLYESRSALQVMEALNNRSQDDLETISKFHQMDLNSETWRSVLANGVMMSVSTQEAPPALKPNLMAAIPDASTKGIELRFAPDQAIHDGSYSNNPWLQELPRPLTNLTWDNAVEMGHKLASQLGVAGPYKHLGLIPGAGPAPKVKVTVGGKSVEMPVYVNLGMADDTVVVRMGYGRTRVGKVGNKGDDRWHGGGFNIYPLRNSQSPWIVADAVVEKTSGGYELANTQFHNTLEVEEIDTDRDIIRHANLADYKANPMIFASKGHGGGAEAEHGGDKLHNGLEGQGGHTDAHSEGAGAAPTGGTDAGGDGRDLNLYDGSDYKDLYAQNMQWAMTVDLNLCTGCNACVVACQSENNIPTVGKREVMRGREMHWIRIDRYYKGNGSSLNYDNPPIYFQPLACVQCEQAPCEPVCPVAATVHSSEGLNQMVYNRCVGTRYCSNNCPYKVRRFNFLHFTKPVHDLPVLKLLQNPDVTVRTRGVMEKCTYCVQRINEKRINAKVEGKEVQDGEIVTACQQACPAQAIVFGNMSDKNSAVSKSRASKRNYILLEVTNTRPRTTYLGRVHNPNPEVKA
ncbi:MAG: 4Fe-4S dicluster domain-containing protein [Armatimonadota bacterium]|jgi:Fe-S-cluster-containing dehydrogenase component